MEIKVNDYVRLDRNQGIRKIEEIDDDGYWLDDYIADEFGESTRFIYEDEIDENIIKHSFNIIDLIEIGDYVNGYKVDDIENGHLIIGDTTQVIEQIVDNKEIKSIVTKEQFSSLEYKI